MPKFIKRRIPSVIAFAAVLALTGGVSIALGALNFDATHVTGSTDVIIDGTGALSIGTSSATEVQIGKNGASTTVNGNTTLGLIPGDAITLNAGTMTVSNDLGVTLSGGVNGINFDSNTLSIDAQNHRVGIGTATPNASLDVNGTILEKGPAANVKAFGAIGDGTADDTAAVQAALNASQNVYFPAGSYIVANLTVANDGTRIFGDGVASIIQMKVDALGSLLSTGNKRMALSDLSLYGGSDTSKKGVSSPTADRSALTINSQLNSSLTRVTIHGFENYGILFATVAYDRLSHLIVSDSTIYNTFWAVKATTGEYARFANTHIHDCYYGLYINSGNISASNMVITDNGYGVYVLGTGVVNAAHGNVNGSLINHNTFAIQTDGIDAGLGFNFVGNNIFQGSIYLKNSTGINIEDGIIDATNYYLEGGGPNYIRNNYAPNAYGNVVHHNYNSAADQTLLIDNYVSDGSFIDANHSLVSDGGLLYQRNKLTLADSPGYGSNLIPTMSSDTAPSGTVTKSSQYSSTYASWQAFDHAGGTIKGWATDDTGFPQWIAYQFPTPQAVGRYTIQNINASNDGAHSAPNTWHFQGSNDGSSWTTLDSRSGETSWGSNETRTYTLTNYTTYTHYRLFVTAVNGSTLLQIDEIQMFAQPAFARIGIGTTSPATTLQLSGTQPTLRIGEGAVPGCLELLDSSGNGAINYITASGGVLSTSLTAPAICQ